MSMAEAKTHRPAAKSTACALTVTVIMVDSLSKRWLTRAWPYRLQRNTDPNLPERSTRQPTTA